MTQKTSNFLLVGWREWVGLPELGTKSIKAKVDSGALTSALHAFQIEPDTQAGIVQFRFHPFQKRTDVERIGQAKILDRREIRSSNGHLSHRYVIMTSLTVYDRQFEIELSLANRDEMGFRMLLGRRALSQRFLIDPGASYCDKSHIPRRKRK